MSHAGKPRTVLQYTHHAFSRQAEEQPKPTFLRATPVAQRHTVWRAQGVFAVRDKSKQHVLTNSENVSFCGAEKRRFFVHASRHSPCRRTRRESASGDLR